MMTLDSQSSSLSVAGEDAETTGAAAVAAGSGRHRRRLTAAELAMQLMLPMSYQQH